MKKGAIRGLLVCLLAQAACALPPGVEPKADQILSEMSQYLGGLKEFTFHSEVTMEDTVSGMQVDMCAESDISVHRPDGIRVTRKGDKGNQEAFYDGKYLTLFNGSKNFYAQSAVPSTIEPMLDFANEKLGMVFPLADLLFTNPHEVLSKNTDVGFYVGAHEVGGVLCDHLAFSQPSGLEWQVWVEQGAMRVPRKLVIRRPEEPGAPRFQAVLSRWDKAPKIPADQFHFVAPQGALKIDFKGNK
jgi:hypothetical protein